MKHKLNTLFRVIMVACFSLASISSFASCEEAIKDFYIAYMQNAEEMKEEANIALKQAYMPPQLIAKIAQKTERTDADAVLMAQDVSQYGIKSLTVEPIKDDWYLVKYKFSADSDEIVISVKACDCDGEFKILDISWDDINVNGNSSACGIDCCSNSCDSINMPVFIVDGVEVQAQYLNDLPAEDIEKVEVIKDETITKIFSPRLGGVLLITTKSKRFLTPLLENYNRGIENARQNRIPGQLLIRGDSISADSSPIFFNPDLKPSFPGGESALQEFLESNLQYPEEAKRNNEHGRVDVGFYVDVDGTVTNPCIIRGCTPSLDAEALRIVSIMPEWNPGKQSGEPKIVAVTLPVIF